MNTRPPYCLVLVVLLTCGWSAVGFAQQAPDAVARSFAQEPSVDRVRQVALQANGYGQDDLDRWSSRARWSHLLPEVEGEVAWLDQRDRETSYQEDLETNDSGTMYRDSARNDFVDDSRLRTIYAVELEWDLSGLVYDRSEPTIAREVRRRREARRDLLVAVGEAYFQRRRYLSEFLLTPKAQWRKRMDLRLEADRQTARLDAMTGGWFSRALRKAQKEER